MNLSRRGFLTGLIAAPLVVPANRLMRLRGIVMPSAIDWGDSDVCTLSYFVHDGSGWRRVTKLVRPRAGILQVEMPIPFGGTILAPQLELGDYT